MFFFPNKANNNIVYISETLNLIFGNVLPLFFSFGCPYCYKNLNGCVITAFKTISRDPML